MNNLYDSSFSNTIKKKINNGEFKTTGSGGNAVYSENLTNFISSGKFNSDVSKYEKTKATIKYDIDNMGEVAKIEKNNFNYIFIFISLILVAILLFGYLKFKKKFLNS